MRPLLCSLVAACGPAAWPPDRACDEIPYAIAERTRTCSDDEAIALARWEAVRDAPCDLPPEAALACADAISALPCEVAGTLGDAADAWVAAGCGAAP